MLHPKGRAEDDDDDDNISNNDKNHNDKAFKVKRLILVKKYWEENSN